MLPPLSKVTGSFELDKNKSCPDQSARKQCQIWLPTHIQATQTLFRGSKPLFRIEEYSYFTSAQRSELASIDIAVNSNTLYVGGLVSVQMKENLSPCLSLLRHNIEQQVLRLWSNKTLYKMLHQYYTEQRTLFSRKQPSVFQIRYCLQKLRQVQDAIGLLLLPKDFLSLLVNPNGFVTTTLYHIGIYALTFVQDLDPMFLINIESDANSENPTGFQEAVTLDLVEQLEEGLIVGPTNTPLFFRESKIEEPQEVHYPSLNKTRKFNNRQALESKARTAVRIYNKITLRLKRMTPKEKQLEIAKIRSLRPAMRTLKAYYRAQGDSSQVVNMLVTPMTYPDLPQVKITKRHQKVLLDVLHGKADLHTNFIQQGFLK